MNMLCTSLYLFVYSRKLLYLLVLAHPILYYETRFWAQGHVVKDVSSKFR